MPRRSTFLKLGLTWTGLCFVLLQSWSLVHGVVHARVHGEHEAHGAHPFNAEQRDADRAEHQGAATLLEAMAERCAGDEDCAGLDQLSLALATPRSCLALTDLAAPSRPFAASSHASRRVAARYARGPPPQLN